MTGRMMRYNTIQYNTIRYDTIRYDTIQYDTIRYTTNIKFKIIINAIKARNVPGSPQKITNILRVNNTTN
jgi:hypothetical protein